MSHILFFGIYRKVICEYMYIRLKGIYNYTNDKLNKCIIEINPLFTFFPIRCSANLSAHDGEVNGAGLSWCGHYLASWGTDAAVVLWDIRHTSQPLHTLRHDAEVMLVLLRENLMRICNACTHTVTVPVVRISGGNTCICLNN